MRSLLTLICITFLCFSCKQSSNNEISYSLKTNTTATTHPGKKLIEINCYVCHSPTADHDNRIAPPMIAVKKHYLDEGMSKTDFINAIQNWIENPSEENAKMVGAVRRFGVMPKQLYPEKTIKEIADYMYSEELDQPEWFEDHFKTNHEEAKGDEKHKGKGLGYGKRKQTRINHDEGPKVKVYDSYADRGLDYALSTKAVLGKNLMGTIQKKGTIEALSFCNIKAYPLTDSMAVVHNAEIKRVSDRPRNPKNLASEYEIQIIDMFKTKLASQSEIEPLVDEKNTEIDVYYPIVTNSMCLQCHGKPNKNISSQTLSKLSELYPGDKATGYDVNQIRGIWSVKFKK